jgi:hypothetical protein
VFSRALSASVTSQLFTACGFNWEVLVDSIMTQPPAVNIHLRLHTELRSATTIECFVLNGPRCAEFASPVMRRMVFTRDVTQSESFPLVFKDASAVSDIQHSDLLSLRMGFLHIQDGPVSSSFTTERGISITELSDSEPSVAEDPDHDDPIDVSPRQGRRFESPSVRIPQLGTRAPRVAAVPEHARSRIRPSTTWGASVSRSGDAAAASSAAPPAAAARSAPAQRREFVSFPRRSAGRAIAGSGQSEPQLLTMSPPPQFVPDSRQQQQLQEQQHQQLQLQQQQASMMGHHLPSPWSNSYQPTPPSYQLWSYTPPQPQAYSDAHRFQQQQQQQAAAASPAPTFTNNGAPSGPSLYQQQPQHRRSFF